ncbi:hypothetical protein LC040_19470 [Bacillus tianshenii]|nr:hypothetical protein LC040_19470 [Bacillus tianshenii]
MENKQLEKYVHLILQRSGSTANVILEKHFPGKKLAGGKYNIGTHTITLYIEDIKEQCVRLFSSLDRFPEYFAIVFAHELGHAEDSQLEALADQLDVVSDLERKKIALQIEENAWNFAQKLLREADEAFMNEIIDHSLRAYREAIQLETA